jgi:hypothetical protein
MWILIKLTIKIEIRITIKLKTTMTSQPIVVEKRYRQTDHYGVLRSYYSVKNA